MKYFIMIICFLVSSALYATDIKKVDIKQYDKNKPIDIYCKGQYVSSMTIPEWEAAWQMMSDYKKLKDIEDTLIKENKKVGKIDVELQDNIWNIANNKTFTTFAIIKWIDENEKILKQIKVKIIINKVNDPNNKWYMEMIDEYKEHIAPAGCIIFGLTTLLLILF